MTKDEIRAGVSFIKETFRDGGIKTIIPIFLFHYPEYKGNIVRLTNTLQGRCADEDIFEKLNDLKDQYEFNCRRG